VIAPIVSKAEREAMTLPELKCYCRGLEENLAASPLEAQDRRHAAELAAKDREIRMIRGERELAEARLKSCGFIAAEQRTERRTRGVRIRNL
jgi:hypothetical protein